MAANCVALIAAAGSGQRCGAPKQFLPLAAHTVLFHAVQPFVHSERIAAVYVVVAADKAAHAAQVLGADSEVQILPCGGETRAQSVYNGLAAIADDCWVLVHDAARPCLSQTALARLLSYLDSEENSGSAGGSDGAVLALPVTDALKTVRGGQLSAPIARADVWAMQTPQLFRAGRLRQALSASAEAADEAEAVLATGGVVNVLAGEQRNIKITHPEDMALAAYWLAAQSNA